MLNRAVVQGLADLRSDAGEAPFVPTTYPMGLRAGHDPAHLGALGDDIEVDAFLDLSRRLNERTASE